MVGMGAELAEASAAAREVFEEVDEALGQKLWRIMADGPEDQLTNLHAHLHHITIAAGISSVVLLCLAYHHRDAFRIPAITIRNPSGTSCFCSSS